MSKEFEVKVKTAELGEIVFKARATSLKKAKLYVKGTLVSGDKLISIKES